MNSSKDSMELAEALARGFAQDATRSREQLKLAETDFAEGFWEGMALGYLAAAEVCKQSIAIDKRIIGESLTDDGEKVVPIARKKKKVGSN